MTRRFWIGLALDRPGLDPGDGRAISARPAYFLPPRMSNWVQLLLAHARRLWGRLAVLRARLGLAGQPQPEHVHAHRHGNGRRLALQRRRDASPRCLPAAFRGTDGAVAVYFEAAAVITVLVLLGQVLELRAREPDRRRDQGACSDLAPKTARRITRPMAAMRKCRSTRQRRRPPARPPGREGAGGRRGSRRPSAVDESMVTGESMPVEKTLGDQAHRRHRERDRRIVMRAEKIGADTMLSHIVQMVAEAQRSRAPDPAAGRPGGRLVRTGGDRRSQCSHSRLGPSGGPSRALAMRSWMQSRS